jgi:Sec-independent protein translocase protein TatA
MFGIGFWELAVIALVAFLLVRPQQLPSLFRKLGRAYRELVHFQESARRYYDGFREDLNRHGAGEERGGESGDGNAGEGGTSARQSEHDTDDRA